MNLSNVYGQNKKDVRDHYQTVQRLGTQFGFMFENSLDGQIQTVFAVPFDLWLLQLSDRNYSLTNQKELCNLRKAISFFETPPSGGFLT